MDSSDLLPGCDGFPFRNHLLNCTLFNIVLLSGIDTGVNTDTTADADTRCGQDLKSAAKWYQNISNIRNGGN